MKDYIREDWARQAIQEFLDESAAEIMEGITVQGKPRILPPVAVSRFAVPNTYPFVSVNCETASLRNESRSHVHPYASLEMAVEVTDSALIQSTDETQFETLDQNFRLMCDRMISKIVDRKKFCSQGHCFQLIIKDPIITKRNIELENSGADNTIDMLLFGCSIEFDLEEC